MCSKLFGKRIIEIDYAMEKTVTFVTFSENFETYTIKEKSLKRVDSDCFSVGVLDSTGPNLEPVKLDTMLPTAR